MALTTTSQRCALCLNTAPLKVSHGIPAGVYRLLGRISEDGPVSMTSSDGWEPLTRQDKRQLLCSACEAEIAVSEDWVLRRAPRRGRFRLMSLLLSQPPDYRWPNVEVFKTINRPAIDVHRLCYFATSIFWRYAVASWPSGHTIRLGKYSEELRVYLRGGPFPLTARLTCFVSRLTATNPVLMMPNTAKANGFFLHQFVIPGFDFVLVIGNNAPDTFDKFCLSSSVEKPLIVSERSDSRRHEQLLRAMDQADASNARTTRKRSH